MLFMIEDNIVFYFNLKFISNQKMSKAILFNVITVNLHTFHTYKHSYVYIRGEKKVHFSVIFFLISIYLYTFYLYLLPGVLYLIVLEQQDRQLKTCSHSSPVDFLLRSLYSLSKRTMVRKFHVTMSGKDYGKSCYLDNFDFLPPPGINNVKKQ